jgi:broad-specificity NMP kinase
VKIIEISGVPGSGKTTFINNIKKILPKGWSVFPIDSPSLPLIGKLINKIKIIFYLFIFLLFEPRFSYQIIIYISDALKNISETTYTKFYLFINILFKIGHAYFINKFNNKNGIIIDEGLSHIPFNFLSYNSNHINSDWIELMSFLKKLTKNINLVIINTNKEEVKKRITNRGHKRLNKGIELNTFIEMNFTLIKMIEDNSYSFFKTLDMVNSENITTKDFLSHYINNN